MRRKKTQKEKKPLGMGERRSRTKERSLEKRGSGNCEDKGGTGGCKLMQLSCALNDNLPLI